MSDDTYGFNRDYRFPTTYPKPDRPQRPEHSVHPAAEFADALVSDFDFDLTRSDRGYLIMGPSGTGKTHLAAALHHEAEGEKLFASAGVWNEAIWCERRRSECTVFPLEELLEVDRPYNPAVYLDPWVYKPRSVISRASTAAWTTIDDYGTEEHAANRKALFTIIDHRVANKIPVVVTTNLDWSQLKTIDERLFDRLRVLECVKLLGRSRRARP